MLFVDGENLTLEGQKVARKNGLTLNAGKYHLPDVFLWMPDVRPTKNLYEKAYLKVQKSAIRSYYYTSMTGNRERMDEVRKNLRDIGFHPEVFNKPQGRTKSKGVDITLAKDMLSHCFHGNYDVAVLFAGDGDYVPLVTEVKRMGKVVYLAFFEHSGLSPELHLASDHFLDIEKSFIESWKYHKASTSSDK
jgi:uncharacterized LabA/DUF88 family protein